MSMESHRVQEENCFSYIPFILIVFLLFSGCSVLAPVGDFISQRYVNATAYFNTYYNASTAFDDALTELQKYQLQQTAKEQKWKIGDVPTTSKKNFDASIEKLSKLLMYYPTSKWIDRSLMMIGEAYYYENELVKSERKFLELLAQLPNSEYRLDARLWLGRVFMAQNKLDSAKQHLTFLVQMATDQKAHEIVGESGLLLGDINLLLNDTTGAISAYRIVLTQSNDDELRARAQLNIGDVYAMMDSSAQAMEAYQHVQELGPDPQTEYLARKKYADFMLTLGRYSEAESRLDELMSINRYRDYRAQIELSYAIAKYKKGKIREADDYFAEIDTLYPRSDASAQSLYYQGLIQEKHYNNYDSALKFFDRSKAEFLTSSITPRATAKAETIQRYVANKRQIKVCDSLLNIYCTKKDSLARLDSLRQKNITQAPTVSVNPKVDSSIGRHDQIVPSNQIPPKDSLDQPNVRRGLKPLSEPGITANRDSLISNKILTKRDSLLLKSSTPIDKKKDTSKVKEAPIRLDSVKIATDKLIAMYDLASLFYIQMTEIDSALTVFNAILSMNPPADIAVGSLYTMSQIYKIEKKDSIAKSDSLYSEILHKHPRSRYAKEIRRQRNLPAFESEDEKKAETMFLEAEKLMLEEKHQDAIERHRLLVTQYPKTEFAAQSEYAIGWLFENELFQPDSAAVWYTTLSKEHSTSQYAARIKDRLTEYENAKRKAIEDSIKSVKEDSIAQARAKQKQAAQKDLKADSLSTVKPSNAQEAKKDTSATKKQINPQEIKKDSLKLVKPDSLRTDKNFPNSRVVEDSTSARSRLIKRDSTKIKRDVIE